MISSMGDALTSPSLVTKTLLNSLDLILPNLLILLQKLANCLHQIEQVNLPAIRSFDHLPDYSSHSLAEDDHHHMDLGLLWRPNIQKQVALTTFTVLILTLIIQVDGFIGFVNILLASRGSQHFRYLGWVHSHLFFLLLVVSLFRIKALRWYWSSFSSQIYLYWS